MQRSVVSARNAILTIDKRRAGGLSSEKIFVAVCERLLTRANASEDCFTHTSPQWAAIDLESTRGPSSEFSLQRFSALREVSDGHHVVDSGARLALVKALATLDPRNAGFGLDESLSQAQPLALA